MAHLLFPTAIITVMSSVKIKASASVDSAPASSFTQASIVNATPANVFLLMQENLKRNVEVCLS